MMTRQQQRCLDVLHELTADGWPASVREVAARMGWKSSATAHEMLVRLQNLGYAEGRGRKGWKPLSDFEVARRTGQQFGRWFVEQHKGSGGK